MDDRTMIALTFLLVGGELAACILIGWLITRFVLWKRNRELTGAMTKRPVDHIDKFV
jgi:hypothetical protein